MSRHPIFGVTLYYTCDLGIMQIISWEGEAPSAKAARDEAQTALPNPALVRRTVIERDGEPVSDTMKAAPANLATRGP